MKIIDGKKIAKKIQDKIVEDIIKINSGEKSNAINKRPGLAIILIGNRKDSLVYVKAKEKAAKKVGVDTHLYKLPSSAKQEDVLDLVKYLNNDIDIGGILIQLPLPKKFDTNKIIQTVKKEKDVDMFNSENVKSFLKPNNKNKILPPVFGACLEILKDIKIKIKGKKICIISNSDIFGLNLKKVFENLGARVENIKIENKNLKNKTKKADILISVIGKPRFIKKDFLKKDAIIIDVGINRDKNNKLCGDVDFDDVKDVVSAITPVPGGVGPITVAKLLKNTLELYKKQ